AVAQAAALVARLVATPAAQRAEPAKEATQLLDAALAGAKPDETRIRACLLYDKAVVAYLAGDFAEAIATLQAAEAENAKQADGIFGSSGKQLANRVAQMLVSAKDRAAREAAAR
nr:hypothetical protein [Planctomycetota bacterium]